MGLVRDLAAYGIQRATGGTAKPGAKRAQPGETPGQESLDRAAAGPDQKKRSTGSDLASMAEKRLASGGSKRGGVDTSQYSVGSMGLSGSIPGQESDLGGDNSSARRKRSNGKLRL